MTTHAIRDGLGLAIEAHEDLLLVTLVGPLDVYTAPALRRHVTAHALAGDQIVIDLTRVRLMDSAGLGALVRLLNHTVRNGPGCLGLVCSQRHLLRLIEIAGLSRVFTLGPDLPAVRAALVAERGSR